MKYAFERGITMNEQTLSAQFLSTYNELDAIMRECLAADERMSHTNMIKEMAKTNLAFRKNEEDLKLFARLRNAIVHDSFNLKNEPIAEPHQKIVQMYEEIKSSAIHPPIALETIAIMRQDIFTVSLQDNALSVMQTMNDKIYTHVPVLVNEIIYGIFSENTIFSYLVRQKEAIFDETMRIDDFKEQIEPDFPKSETFLFVPSTSTVYDIEDMFNNEFKCHKRIAAIYITETGKQSEPLLGMITPWDVLGNT